MKTKLFLIFALTILAISFTSAFCTDSVNVYLTFTDSATQKTLEVFQGDSVRLTSVAYSYSGPLWYEKLEILNKQVLFTKYESGQDKGFFYLFTNTHTLDTSSLPEGTYTIRFTSSTLNDCSMEYEELTLIVKEQFIDDQCPIVDITYPEATTYDSRISSISFDVNEDVKLESCSFVLNGVTYNFDDCVNGSNSWESLITMKGQNTLTVYATDNSSNTCSDSVTFNIEIPEVDDQCPVVEFQSPLNGQTYDHFLTQATFTISEENSLASCIYTLNNVMKEFSCQKGTNTLAITTKEGPNMLVISVKDDSNNICPKTINFDIELPEPPVDNCPTVNIIEPENGKTYNELIETLKFTIDEDYKLNSCKYNLNGINYTVQNCLEGLNTLNTLSTKEGLNSLTVYATDNASQTCSDSVSFNIDVPEVDDKCPVISVSSPLQGKTYTNHLSTATFTISEENSLDTNSCKYTMNGITKTFNCKKGTNTISINTKEGPNTLTITVKDEFGNSCPKTITFNVNIPEVDDECPEINILSPQSKTYNNLIKTSTYTLYDENQIESCYFILNGDSSQRYSCDEGTNYLNNLNTKENSNTLTIFARDEFMNECSDSVTFNIDLEDENETDDNCPLVEITFPQSKVYDYFLSKANFNVNEDIKLDSCSFVLNGNSVSIPGCVNGSNSLSDLITIEGTNTLTIYATDNSSNTCSDSVTFKITLDNNETENETCEDCCADPDYYDYYYEDNSSIESYYWKGDTINLNKPDSREELNWLQKFWAWLKGLFS